MPKLHAFSQFFRSFRQLSSNLESFAPNYSKIFISGNVWKRFLRKPLLITSVIPPFFVVHAAFSNKQNITVMNLINKADDLYTENKFNELYDALHAHRDSTDVEILWRLARASFEKGKASSSNSDKIKLFEEGMAYVRTGLNINDNHAVLHKWFAVLNDYKSRCEGTKSRIQNALVNKEHMMRSVELCGNDSTVIYMLGYWCFAFASLAWYERKIASVIFATPPTSTFDEALEYFEKAEKMNPNFYSMNLLMLGKCYEKLGNKEKAIFYLTETVNYKGNSSDDLEAKADAQVLLKKLGK